MFSFFLKKSVKESPTKNNESQTELFFSNLFNSIDKISTFIFNIFHKCYIKSQIALLVMHFLKKKKNQIVFVNIFNIFSIYCIKKNVFFYLYL